MKNFLKIFAISVCIFLAMDTKAQAINTQVIYLNAPSIIISHQTGLIFLAPLQMGVSYTVTCDISNANYSKKYPVIIGIISTRDIYDNKATFIINNIQPKYKQALLNHNDNKFVAMGVIQSIKGASIGIRNYDDSDAIYVSNCMATETT